MTLTAEQLLAGAELVFEVEVPAALVAAGSDATAPGASGGREHGPWTVRLRPLRVSDLQTVGRAAAESDQLFATLMVQRALVEPALSVAQVAAMPAGLVHHLLGEVNRCSGLDGAAETTAAALEAPVAQAAFLLAKAFGWTPTEVNELTLGQVLLYLELLRRDQA